MDTVLIVEDEKMIRQGLRAMIAHSDVPISRILDCRNGAEALMILKNEKVDLIITDVRMPKMDGITFMKHLKKQGINTPTIVISGYDDFSYAVEVLRCGAIDYMLKPVERKALVDLLRKTEDNLKQKVVRDTEKKSTLAYQLRYLFSQNDLTSEEQKVVWNDVDDNVESGDYCVIASKPGGLHRNKNYHLVLSMALKQGIFLKNLEDMDILIAKAILIPEDIREDKLLGISDIFRDAKEIKVAYLQAVYDRKEKFFATAEQYVKLSSGEDIEKSMMEASNYLLIKQEFLMSQIAGMFRAAYDKSISYIQVETILEQLLNHMKEQYSSFQELEDKLLHPYYYNTISEYDTVLQEYIAKINQKLSKSKSTNSIDKLKVALEYIDKNYARPLNMAVISNHISMNYSLFSLSFKQYTGENFVVYLHKIRIEKAKELLYSTDLRTKDICILVGFEDEKHFYRIFKQLCGVSPKDYRMNILAVKGAK